MAYEGIIKRSVSERQKEREIEIYIERDIEKETENEIGRGKLNEVHFISEKERLKRLMTSIDVINNRYATISHTCSIAWLRWRASRRRTAWRRSPWGRT